MIPWPKGKASGCNPDLCRFESYRDLQICPLGAMNSMTVFETVDVSLNLTEGSNLWGRDGGSIPPRVNSII